MARYLKKGDKMKKNDRIKLIWSWEEWDNKFHGADM